MRSGVLLDSGPLVAYHERRDACHAWAVATWENLELPLITCEPVIVEVSFLLGRARSAASWPIEMVERGVIQIGLRIEDEAARISALMQRYADVPMSLADACLVRLAELTGLPICTLDSDFAIYRAQGRRALDLIIPDRRSLHEL